MIAKRFKTPIAAFSRNARVGFQNDYFVVKFVKNHIAHNRVGVVISKKYSKSAVVRNRAKRRIFDFFRIDTDFLKKECKNQGFDLLIIVNPSMINLDSITLRAELKNYERIIF
jgi:ribonuclease P protein component